MNHQASSLSIRFLHTLYEVQPYSYIHIVACLLAGWVTYVRGDIHGGRQHRNRKLWKYFTSWIEPASLPLIISCTAHWRMREKFLRGQQFRDTSSSCSVLSSRPSGPCTSVMISSLPPSGFCTGGVIGMSDCGLHCHQASFRSHCARYIFLWKSCCLVEAQCWLHVCVRAWSPCLASTITRLFQLSRSRLVPVFRFQK